MLQAYSIGRFDGKTTDAGTVWRTSRTPETCIRVVSVDEPTRKGRCMSSLTHILGAPRVSSQVQTFQAAQNAHSEC